MTDAELRELIANPHSLHGTLVDVCRELLEMRQTIADMQFAGAETATLAELTMAQAERDAYRAKIPQWIPCAERLPDSNEAVIVCSMEPKDWFGPWIACAFRCHDLWLSQDKCYLDADSEIPFTVSHWQPLPSPPVTATEPKP